jgi:DNA-binding CsgD family transcriptional regulator
VKTFIFIFILLSHIFYSQDRIKIQKDIDSLITIVGDKNSNAANRGTKEMLRLCTEIYYQSKSINYDNGILSGIYGMAGIYTDEQNYEEALKKIPEGISLAEKTSDYRWWCKLLMMEGIIYSNLGYNKKSQEALNKAIDIVNNYDIKGDQHFVLSTIYGAIAVNFSNTSKVNVDSTIFYLNKAYTESKKIEKKYEYRIPRMATNALNLAAMYFEKKDVVTTEKYLAEFELIMKNEKYRPYFSQFYQLKGHVENKKKNYSRALEYFNNSLKIIHEYKLSSRELKETYKGMSESYLGLNDFKNEALYLSKIQKITDSISIAEKNVLNNTISTQNQNVAGNSGNYNYVIAAILALMAVFTIYIFFAKEPKKRITPSKNVEIPVLEDKNSPDAAGYEKEKQPEKDVQILRELLNLVQNKDKSFHLKFSEAFPEFDQKLLQINPALTHSDLEYCALMKLKFETKEIAQYKNVTVNSVESKKYRLRKKLDIPTNIDIYTWMLKII